MSADDTPTPPAPVPPAPTGVVIPPWLLLGALIAAAVMFLSGDKTPRPDDGGGDGGNNPPAVVRTVGELQLAATCDVFAAALSTRQSDGRPYFATTADVWEAWQYSDRFAFGGVSLTPSEKRWAQAAEIRIRDALGQAGAETAVVLDDAKAAKAAAEFTQLAAEIREKGA